MLALFKTGALTRQKGMLNSDIILLVMNTIKFTGLNTVVNLLLALILSRVLGTQVCEWYLVMIIFEFTGLTISRLIFDIGLSQVSLGTYSSTRRISPGKTGYL